MKNLMNCLVALFQSSLLKEAVRLRLLVAQRMIPDWLMIPELSVGMLELESLEKLLIQ